MPTPTLAQRKCAANETVRENLEGLQSSVQAPKAIPGGVVLQMAWIFDRGCRFELWLIAPAALKRDDMRRTREKLSKDVGKFTPGLIANPLESH